ncbi:MAG TPA: nucleotidyltransferase family protein, partial [bacterium]|nr:nucleotidyltransferase family protein [bacterium]
MNALILAAGFGTRMRPFTNTHPKALVPVNGIPLILYSLAFLKKHGIKNIVINLHHHGRVIKKYLGNGKKIGMTIRYSNEPHILGTGGGIKKALRYLDETTLVINGDILMDFSLTSFLAQHNKKSPLATLLLFQHKNARDFGLIHHNQQSVTSILGSPAPHTKDHSAMFTGIYLITKSLLKKELDKHPANKLF